MTGAERRERFDSIGVTMCAFAKQNGTCVDTLRIVLQRGHTVLRKLRDGLAAHGIAVELRPVSAHWRLGPMVNTKNAERAWSERERTSP